MDHFLKTYLLEKLTEYYTQMQIVWDELENMSNLPTIKTMTDEMTSYLEAVEQRAEERRLFQFLNGLDMKYGAIRSSLLLMSPLPTVDTAASVLLQEETQSNNLSVSRDQEITALMIKGEFEDGKCKHCGRKNHKSEQCWEKVGYPEGHPKHRKSNYSYGNKGASSFKYVKPYLNNKQNNNYGGTRSYKGTAANAKTKENDLTVAIEAATQRLEEFLKLVPGHGNNNNEELECNFAGL